MSDDNIKQFPGKTWTVAAANDMLVQRMLGVEGWEVTPMLRWNGTVLEQMLRGSSGSVRWEPVPQANEMPQ